MISRRRAAFVSSSSQLVVSQFLCGFIKNLKRARDVLNECFLPATTSTKPPDLIALDCAINVTNENETRLVPDGAEQKEPPVADDAHVTEKV